MNKITGYFLWLAILVFAGAKAFKIMSALSGAVSTDIFNLIIMTGIYTLLCGFALSAVVYKFLFFKTSNSLNEYKRELEKESIDKTENSSKIKVLESKITVLEKALEEALKK